MATTKKPEGETKKKAPSVEAKKPAAAETKAAPAKKSAAAAAEPKAASAKAAEPKAASAKAAGPKAAPAKKPAAAKAEKPAPQQLELPVVPAPAAAAIPAAAPSPAPGPSAAQVATDWNGAHDAVVAAGDGAAALVEAWIQAKNAAAVAAIAEDDAAPGPARKAARRGLNVLRSRGVAIPERPPRIVRLAAPEPESFEAWLWAPDPSGASLLTIAAVTPGGRCRRADVVIGDRSGILSVRGGEASRGQLRENFDQAESQMGYRPVPVPVEWARARIAEARKRSEESRAILPQGLDRFADLVGPAPATAPVHPIDAAELPAVEAAGAVATSHTLHAEPEFRGWIPSGEAVQEMLAKLGAALGSQEALQNEELVGKTMDDEIAAATDRFFTPELRQTIAVRMKDIAISVLARAGKQRAAEVMAIAKAIESAGLITSPPRDIPFLRAMFAKALAVISAQRGGSIPIPLPQQAPSPIVSPTAAASEKAQPGEKVSPGGIILP